MITGATSWFTFGGGITKSEAVTIVRQVNGQDKVVTRLEVSQMIQTESPYQKDKSGIQQQLRSIEDTLDRIVNKLDAR